MGKTAMLPIWRTEVSALKAEWYACSSVYTLSEGFCRVLGGAVMLTGMLLELGLMVQAESRG